MTRKKKQRLMLIGGAGMLLTIATAFVLTALSDQIVYFYTPGDLTANDVRPGTRIRLGGLVGDGSIRQLDNSVVAFTVDDGTAKIDVRYKGLLPDLFREGQGVVMEGTLSEEGGFIADNVLAKHDENYMPREVADALKKKGVWNEGDKAQ
jgi:cytochrome c-type biogenesis protein CcmE